MVVTYKSVVNNHNVFDNLSFSASLERTMLDASVDCIKMVSPEGRLLYMNRAGCIALGVAADSGFGMAWLPLLPESVHEAGREALARAGRGENARFPGRSEAGGAVIYWDNLLTPVSDDTGAVKWILCVSRDVTAQTLLERELDSSLERERLLAHEMRHRIKNVFSVVASLVSMAEREAIANATPCEPLKSLRGKLEAFGRVSDAAFAIPPGEGDMLPTIPLRDLADAVLKPYAERIAIKGETVSISNQIMTAIALVLHELATNSVKYGALGNDTGHVRIEWTMDDGTMVMRWTEEGGPPVAGPPARQGFGTRMIERFARSLGGRIVFDWPQSGLVVSLSLTK